MVSVSASDGMNILTFAWIAGAAAIVYGLFLMWSVLKQPTGTDKMKEIAQAILDGSKAYLKREFLTILVVGIVVDIVLWFTMGKAMVAGFTIGAVASMLAGYVGMFVAVKSNVRVAEAARANAGTPSGLKKAFALAFRGGSVTGFLVAGLAL